MAAPSFVALYPYSSGAFATDFVIPSVDLTAESLTDAGMAIWLHARDGGGTDWATTVVYRSAADDGATFNQSATFRGRIASIASGSARTIVELWTVDAPNQSVAGEVAVADGGWDDVEAEAVVYNNVGGWGTPVTESDTGANTLSPTVLTTQADSLCAVGFSMRGGVHTWTPTGDTTTELHDGSTGSGFGNVSAFVGEGAAPTIGTYVMSALCTQADDIVAVAVEILGTASGGTDATATPSGVSATGSVGSAQVNLSPTVSVSGVEGTGAVGTVTVSTGVNDNAAPSGVEATASVGSVSVTTSATTTVDGVSATGQVGTVTAIGEGAAAAPSGVAAIGEAGGVTIALSPSVAITGVAAAGGIGTVTILGWLIEPSASDEWTAQNAANDVWAPVAAAAGTWTER